MKNAAHRRATVLAGLLLVALGNQARATESMESWAGPGTAGWSNDTAGASLSNPGGYLDFKFNAQSVPALVEDRAWVELPGSVLLTNLQFQFQAVTMYPSALRVVFHSRTNNHIWQLNLTAPTVGAWQPYAIPMAYGPGWFMGPEGSAEAFAFDLLHASRVSVYVRRHGHPAEQHYALDDFTLQGLAIPPGDRDADGMPDDWESGYALNPDNPADAGGDEDGDGMINYAEFRAGTDPRDVNSVFTVEIERDATPPGAPVEGVVLRWNSISNRTYAVWRTLDLVDGDLNPVDAGVPSTPPVTEYLAPVATNEAAAFYIIEVEEP